MSHKPFLIRHHSVVILLWDVYWQSISRVKKKRKTF